MSSNTCFSTGARATRARGISRAAIGLALVLAAFAPTGAEARTRSYAIVDFETGILLKSVNPDTRLSPASLTKMMTLYLVFEAVQDGKLSLNQKIVISKRAAGMPPTKLGLRAGQRVQLRHLISAAAVKSSNDAAVALAEAVAGTEWGFAERMTRKARKLGMSRSSFKNATGFTAKNHRSTARDMALLGRRLIRDFPEHAATFKRKHIRWGGRRWRATNTRFLNAYPGADGIKTGYTRAAGYTIVASASRKGRRVVVSYFGANSASQRTKRVIQLMNAGFNLQRKATTHLASIEPPAPAPRQSPAALPSHDTAVERTDRPKPAAPAVTAALSSPTSGSADRQKKPWAVQVGAFHKGAQARALLDSLAKRQSEIIAGSEPWVFHRGKFHLARLRGFDQTGAQSACARLKAASIDCFTIPAPAPAARTTTAVRTAILNSGSGGWAVQVGRYSLATHARARLDKIRASGFKWLKDRPIRVPRSEDQHYLAWFAGFDEASARIACEKLTDQRIDCLPVQAASPTSQTAPTVAAAKRGGGWQLQVGSFRREGDARKELRRVQKAKIAELQEHTALIRKRKRHHLIRFQGFGPEEARTACEATRRKGFECLAIAPSTRTASSKTGTASSANRVDWAIQVGAYGKSSQALAQLKRVEQGGLGELADARRWVPKPGRYYLARFRNLDETGASAACNRLRAQGVDCLALSPRASP